MEVSHSDEMYSIAQPNRVRLFQKSGTAVDLNRVFNEFFSTMSGEDDPGIMAKRFVETRENRQADELRGQRGEYGAPRLRRSDS